MSKTPECLPRLTSLGIAPDDATALRRIAMTLHRWHEHECNGAIQRDGENGDGKPAWYNADTGKRLFPVADRETGARKRLAAIMARYPHLSAYIQGDPRGAALYVLRPSDVPDGANVDSYYSRGIAVYR